MKVLILGAGIGGLSIAQRLSYEDRVSEIVLIGPDSPVQPGLFYYNKPIDHVAEKEILVKYGSIGEGTFEDYQRKSRGLEEVPGEIRVSSFSLINKSVKGYTSEGLILHPSEKIVREYSNAQEVDFGNRQVKVSSGKYGAIWYSYDLLISTIPLSALISISRHLRFQSSKYKEEFKFSPVYQHQSGELTNDYDEINVMYDLTDSHFYRHSSYLRQGKVQYIVSESIRKFDGATSVIYPGKIVPSKCLTEFVSDLQSKYPSLLCCGRYARWDYHYTVDQSVNDALSYINSWR